MERYVYIICLAFIFFIPVWCSCATIKQDKPIAVCSERVQSNAEISSDLKKYLSQPACESEMMELILTLDNSICVDGVWSEYYNPKSDMNEIGEQIYNLRKKKYDNIDAVVQAGVQLNNDILNGYLNSRIPVMVIQYDVCRIADLIKIPVIETISPYSNEAISILEQQLRPIEPGTVVWYASSCSLDGVPCTDEQSRAQNNVKYRVVQIALEFDDYLFDPNCESKRIDMVLALDDSLTAWEMKSPKYDSGFEAYNDREHIAAQTQKKRGEIIDSIIKAGIEIDREVLENYRTSNMPMEFQYDRCKLKDLLKIPSLLGIEIREYPIDD